MPVIATPVDAPVTTNVGCEDLATSRPEVTLVDGIPIPERRQAIQVAQGQATTIEWIIRDLHGNPVDLVTCGIAQFTPSSESSPSSTSSLSSSSPPTFYSSYSPLSSSPATGDGSVFVSGMVKLRIMETLSIQSQNVPDEVIGTVIDASRGVVQFQLIDCMVAIPGIYLMEFGVYNQNRLVFTNAGYLVVNRGLYGPELTLAGPPSIAEIRLHLRDSAPEDNYLLDTVEYDLAEVAACIERPIMYWNEAPPPIPKKHTTSTFSDRFHWLEGIIACLYSLAAHHYRRNHVAHTAAGVALNDHDKAAEYEQKAQQKWTEYKQWTNGQKKSINMGAAMGRIGLYGLWRY